MSNFDKEPKEINKIVKIADWYGEKLQEKWEIEFVPKKLKITWFLGETDTHYHFYCIYRRSQDKAVEVFAPKNGILTDFLMEDYHDVEFDPTPYEGKSGFKLYEHQIDTIKFLLSRKKGIVSLDMGMGKTISAIVAALEGKYEHILVISPSSKIRSQIALCQKIII